jgi:hypothetical protein
MHRQITVGCQGPLCKFLGMNILRAPTTVRVGTPGGNGLKLEMRSDTRRVRQSTVARERKLEIMHACTYKS